MVNWSKTSFPVVLTARGGHLADSAWIDVSINIIATFWQDPKRDECLSLSLAVFVLAGMWL